MIRGRFVRWRIRRHQALPALRCPNMLATVARRLTVDNSLMCTASRRHSMASPGR
jgi:hypothetical protein